MRSQARTPAEYLAAAPPERRPHLEALRDLVKRAVPDCQEGIAWDMLAYQLAGRPFAAMASHKSYLSLYLMDLYTQPGLREKHAAALAPLKMGKSCINFQSIEELPLDTISAILREARNVVVTSGTLAAGAATKRTTKKATPNKAKRK